MAANERGHSFARRIGRRDRPGAPPTSPVAAPISFPTAPARPIPPGWAEAELHAVMLTFALDNAPRGELAGYVEDAFWRFLHTWGLVSGAQGRVLELGANPYFISFLLDQCTDLDVTLANYFGSDRGAASQELTWIDRDGTERSHTMKSELFNIEEDPYPYDTASFDVVLFCEIIEHLLMDPLHALREIHRVLKPGGQLVVTTPNVARLENVLMLVAGGNMYDPYSGFGPYGRHNREYTLDDLVRLLVFCGFTVERQFTADAHPVTPDNWLGYDQVAPALTFRGNDLGQYLFVSVRATGVPKRGRPDFLFRSYPPGDLVPDT